MINPFDPVLHPKPFCLRFQRSRKAKFIAMFTAWSLIWQLVFPNISLALTAGPASPEFSSFEPVATTNMVNEFTGQFTYNIPVLEVPGANGAGYALSLSYHAGDGPETEASWVGYGWTLNPGAITRNKRGLPDDFKNQPVRHYNNVPPNWTVALSPQLGLELFSAVGANVSQTIRYNNYKGFGLAAGVGLSVFNGALALGFNLSEGQVTFSPSVNPGALLSKIKDKTQKNNETAGIRSGKQDEKVNVHGSGKGMRNAASSFIGNATSSYISYLITDMNSPYNITPYDGMAVTGSVSVTPDIPPAPVSFSSFGGVISYTQQTNKGDRRVKSYGYMYSGHAKNNDSAGAECVMDYTVDRPTTFNKRDKYLPVPFSTADAYFVSGEGLGGSFRMYNDKVGIFSPNYVQSQTTSRFFGLDVHLGEDIGIGGETILDGDQTLTVKSSWSDGNGNTDDFKFEKYDSTTSNNISEPVFFRFNNDLGGKVDYDASGNSNKPVAATIPGGPTLSTSMKELQKDRQVAGNLRRNGRASYIGFHTNKEMKKLSATGKRALAYEQRETINAQAGRNEPANTNALDDQVGEISVYNEDGNNYVYGLPVYSGGEKNMQQGLSSVTDGNNYWVLGDVVNNTTKVGEEYLTPYANAYLLTQITTPDYVDVNLNGPDDEDFGGYTKFSYKRAHGDDNKLNWERWYKWRAPYNGAYFNPMRLSDNTDNMASYQSGYKEVYYLDTIETKTHFAVFVKSSREDGIEANADDGAATGAHLTGSRRLQKLDEIRLYAKGTLSGKSTPTLIKTVYFQYDYSCWPNTDNNANGDGRLTLKRVWTEYNGVVGARVSPYQFDYNYPTSANYPSKYSNLITDIMGLSETPDYTRALDCWGNYEYDGDNRRNKMQSWVSQTPAASFDPAAWQLKRIVLPSGGEIHVQYEQNSYAYVQDRHASVMVPLTTGTDNDDDVFEIDQSVAGVTSSADKARLVNLIKETYKGNTERKIYFKYLYTLMGNGAENLGSCNADYIDGYSSVDDVWLDPVTDNIRIKLSSLPKKICLDYIRHEIGGKLLDGNCKPDGTSAMTNPFGDVSKLKSLGNQLLKTVLTSLAPKAVACKALNPQLSYLRIPVWNKKGGGIRVKRLLMYNKGVDANDPTLYGTEYIYENELTKESYGVATNEPAENKEENPFVQFLDKRDAQGDWDRLIAGKDKEQFEGPMGMSAMPAASVGYSRIIKKNIHQTKSTGAGYSVTDYYTAKDYPVDMVYNMLGGAGGELHCNPIKTEKDKWDIDIGLFSYTINTGLRSSQGYCFIQNQMHGQLKSVADYPGMYTPEKFYNTVIPPTPVAKTTYEYFEPGEQVPMYDYGTYTIYYDQPGKEMDVTIDRRAVEEESSQTRITGDITIGLAYPVEILYAIGFPITSGARQRLNTMTVNKTIHYPAILKKLTVNKEGYEQVTENVAFDPLTTKAVVTRSYDGHDKLVLAGNTTPHNGSFLNYNVPASSQYSDMGQKSWNEHYCYYSVASPLTVTGPSSGIYTVPGVNTNKAFHVGDLIAMHGSSVSVGNVVALSGNDLKVKPAARYNTTISGSGITKVEIIKSGYTNQLSSSTGGWLEYGGNAAGNYIQAFQDELNQKLQYLISLPSTADDSIVVDMAQYGYFLRDWNSYNEFHWSCDLDYFEKIVIEKHAGSHYILKSFVSGYSEPPGIPDPPLVIPQDISNEINSIGPVVNPPTSGFLIIPWICIIPCPAYVAANVRGIFLRNPYAAAGSITPYTPVVPKSYVCDSGTYSRNIIKANITTYGDNWPYPSPFTVPTGFNEYESGERGMWRPVDNYVFRTATTPGSNSTNDERNYKNAGTALMKLGQWVVNYTLEPTKWIHTSQVQQSTPNGYAVEEKDANGVYSAAKYGYRGIFPYAIAQNCQYASVRFESFENLYTNVVEDNVSVIPGNIYTSDAHTGNTSYKLVTGSTGKIQFTNVGPALRGHLVRFWTKDAALSDLSVKLISGSTTTLTVHKVADVSGWTLFEAFSPTSITGGVTYEIANIGSGNILIDDIRIQPVESQMAAYVYDVTTYKVAATLDDQNFATFYQYNGAGKLVRKRIETINGIRTVEEAQYHLPLIER